MIFSNKLRLTKATVLHPHNQRCSLYETLELAKFGARVTRDSIANEQAQRYGHWTLSNARIVALARRMSGFVTASLREQGLELFAVELLTFHERAGQPGELVVVLAQEGTSHCIAVFEDVLYLVVNQGCHCRTVV